MPISGTSTQQPATFGVHGAETPHERAARKHRLIFFGGLAAAVLVVLALIIALTATSGGSDTDGEADAAGDYAVRFLVVGDWGREGKHNQSEVAALMGAVADDHPVDFVVSTGDNMYDSGLTSADDARFDRSFTSVYTADSLQVPWHVVLGNHDYCDSAEGCGTATGCPFSPLHQLNISLARNKDARWHCERSYTHRLVDGRVELFFLDTNPFIQRYYDDAGNTWKLCQGGLMQQSWQAQLLELEHHLNTSTADWKLAVGHHPSYSNGEHQSNADIIQRIEPLFWRYGVQAYFAGHDHNLELLRVPAPNGSQQTYAMVVTGAGSKTDRQQNGTTYSQFYHPWSGFVGATVTPGALELSFYTLPGQLRPAHTTTIPRQG